MSKGFDYGSRTRSAAPGKGMPARKANAGPGKVTASNPVKLSTDGGSRKFGGKGGPATKGTVTRGSANRTRNQGTKTGIGLAKG